MPPVFVVFLLLVFPISSLIDGKEITFINETLEVTSQTANQQNFKWFLGETIPSKNIEAHMSTVYNVSV